MRYCPDCQSPIEDGATFCDNCGLMLKPHDPLVSPPAAPVLGAESRAPEMVFSAPYVQAEPPGDVPAGTCSVCGFQNVPGEMFCQNCGVQLPPVASAPPPLPMPVTGEDEPPDLSGQPETATPSEPAQKPAVAEAGTFCPNCGEPASPTEKFCPNCGQQLPGAIQAGVDGMTPAQPMPVTPPPPIPEPQQTSPSQGRKSGPKLGWISGKLVVVTSGATILIPPGKAELVIGRADPVRNIYPDIDLSLHGGEKSGVSRTHARLVIQGAEMFLEDLNSTNFTFLNQQKLHPGQWYPVHYGDEIRLGLLSLKFMEAG
ncbi:MAG: zinc ribbon domain-containing protein [Anaerolineales bacterium]|nr:zinc ribbon domain-containing protein [Anaerolineales bacterium]